MTGGTQSALGGCSFRIERGGIVCPPAGLSPERALRSTTSVRLRTRTRAHTPPTGAQPRPARTNRAVGFSHSIPRARSEARTRGMS